MEQRLQVGVISSTHGLRGEVKVFPTTDDVTRFKKLKTVILETGKEELELEIQSVKFFKKFAILKFKEFNDINEIEKYKGKPLFINREQAVPLKEDEYFIADLIDLDVFLEDGEAFGTLVDVMQTGANDVYVVEMSDKKEVLLPAIADCIKEIDIEAGKMVIHLMPGLL